MQKVDLIIRGNLLVNNILSGGGVTHCKSDIINKYYDANGAIVYTGDVTVDSFDATDKVVVVTGCFSQKGGGHV